MPARELPPGQKARIVGRYALFQEIAAGGMATLHLGRLIGSAGFSRTVAIKRLHPQFAKDPEFVAMFLDEALLAARVRHPNVVATIDVVALDGELLLVMEYIHGESLSRLLRNEAQAGRRLPLRIVSALMTGVLHGLHAAHEAVTENGFPLGIVHRDVSPHNILVGQDGVGRVLDFGVAKAAWRAQTTRDGQIKGKLAYMAPEQLLNHEVDWRADIFAASAVLWEALTCVRLFSADEPGAVYHRVLNENIPLPSTQRSDVPSALDALVQRGLAKNPGDCFATAREMAFALERTLPPATPGEVGLWVEETARETLAKRAEQVGGIESSSVQFIGSSSLSSPPAAAADAARSSNDALVAAAIVAPALPAAAVDSHKETLGSSIATVSELLPSVELLRGRSRFRRRIAIAVAAVGLAGGGGLALSHILGASSSSPAAITAAPSRPVVPPDRLLTRPAADSVPGQLPAAFSEAGAMPAAAPASPAAAGSPPVTRRQPASPVTQRPASRPAPAAAAARASCNPPYTVDSSGFRVLKPECL